MKLDRVLQEQHMGSVENGFWTWEDLDMEHVDPKDGSIHVYTDIRPVWNPGLRDGRSDVITAVGWAKVYLQTHKACDDFLKRVIENLGISDVNLLQLNADHTDSNGRITARFINSNELLDLVMNANIVETGNAGVTQDGTTVETNSLGASPGNIYVNNSCSDRTKNQKIGDVIHEGFHQLAGADDLEIYRAPDARRN